MTSRAPAARTSASGSRATCDGTWPTSPRAGTRACSTRSRRTTSPTTATRWPRSSRSRTPPGLSVQASPWGLGRTFGGEAESRWVAFHPEECQVLDDGRRVAAACLNSPAYRDFCKEWADWVLECGVDSVFWDEPAWVVPAHVGVDDAERWTCRCDRCAERFGGPVPARAHARGAGASARRRSSTSCARSPTHVAERGGSNTICLLPVDRGHAGPRRLERGRRPPGSGDARDGSVLEALGRGGRPVRAPLRPPAARDGRPSRRRRAALGAELRPRRGRTSPSSRRPSQRRARKASTTSGRGATRPVGT